MFGSKLTICIALLCAVLAFAVNVEQANAQVPVVTYYAPPTTVYYSAPVVPAPVVAAPVTVLRPTPIYAPRTTYYAPTTTYYAPAAVYTPPTQTILYHRGPLGILPRRSVLYTPGYVSPAPVAFPTVGAVYP